MWPKTVDFISLPLSITESLWAVSPVGSAPNLPLGQQWCSYRPGWGNQTLVPGCMGGCFWPRQGEDREILQLFNTLRSSQNGQHLADDIFKSIFLNENVWISLTISLKFVPKVRINNNPSLVQIMAWRWPGDKPLSEPMMVSLLKDISMTWPQRVNTLKPEKNVQMTISSVMVLCLITWTNVNKDYQAIMKNSC